MATIDLATKLGSGLPPSVQAVRWPVHYIEATLDFAAAVTAKGSALATNDIIEVIDLPANSMVLAAGWEKTEALTGTVSVLTADLGVTGIDVDRFVDGDDLYASAVGDFTQSPVSASGPITIGNTADTLDLVMLTQTGTVTGGKLRVWAIVADIADTRKPGITALKS
jgi:hypothetical protein